MKEGMTNPCHQQQPLPADLQRIENSMNQLQTTQVELKHSITLEFEILKDLQVELGTYIMIIG